MTKVYIRLTTIMVAIICGLSGTTFAQQSHITDSAALVALYNATNGSSWTNSTNWLSAQPIDTWYGVTLTGDGRVQSVLLPNNNLAGGPIPNGLAVDSALIILDLSNNALTGSLPYFSDTSMVTLDLSHNQLSGNINYYNLPNLRLLSVSHNLLSGSAAPLDNYPKLMILGASNNRFSTGLPSFFDRSSMAAIDFSNNLFTSGIPFFSSSSLETLDLSNNQLTGEISYWPLPALRNLNISNNLLTGSVGALTNFANAISIYASTNLFTGALPYFGGKDQLVHLDLSHNQLSGGLPYFSNASLRTLNLSHNSFSGSVGYYDLPTLVNFQIDHNNLTGELNINAPASMQVFTANSNKLSGTIIPGFLQLTTLKLDSNKYTFEQIEPKSGIAASLFTYGDQDTTLDIHLNTYVANKLSVSAGGTVANNVYKWYNGGTLEATVVGDSTYAPIPGGLYVVKVTNLLVPSLVLTSKNIGTLLPVQLISFSAGLLKENSGLVADIAWETATETKNKYFDIERSLDGSSFTKVGTVASLATNVSSSVRNSYRYKDNLTSIRGTIYYRLKQVDANDRIQYSKVVNLNIEKLSIKSIAINLYPNPIVNTSQVVVNSLEPVEVSVRIVAANGAITKVGNRIFLQKGNNNLPINFAAYATGTYILQLLDKNNVIVESVMIQK